MRTSLILLALGLIACDGGTNTTADETTASSADIGEVLATVGDMPVGSVEFELAASRVSPEDGKTLSLEERKDILDRLVNDKVLYLEALRRGLDRDPKVQKVMVNTLLRDEVYANVRNSDFSDEELRAYYESNKDDFVVPEKVQVKRILIRVTDDRPADEARTIAEGIRAEIAADPKALFKDAATKHSEDPYRRRGGDVGFVSAEGKPGLLRAWAADPARWGGPGAAAPGASDRAPTRRGPARASPRHRRPRRARRALGRSDAPARRGPRRGS